MFIFLTSLIIFDLYFKEILDEIEEQPAVVTVQAQAKPHSDYSQGMCIHKYHDQF